MELMKGYKQTELGIIPEDWEIHLLGDLIEVERSIRYGIVQPGNFDPNGRYLVRGQDYSFGWANPDTLFRVSSTIEEKYKNARLKSDDLVLTIVGASTGHISTVPNWLNGANITQTTARIPVDKSKTNSEYIKYYLQSEIGQKVIANYIKGAAQPGLNIGDVRIFKVILPKFKEQTAIAQALSDVDAYITSLERLIEKKKAIKQGAMQELLTGQKRVKELKDNTNFKETEIGLIPEDWNLFTYDQAFNFLKTATYSRADLTSEDSFGYIHYGDIHTRWNNHLSLINNSLPTIQEKKIKKYSLIEEGDIVMADASEDYSGVGKCIEIMDLNNQKVIAGLHTFLLRDKGNLFAKGFKGFIHQIPCVVRQFYEHATGMKVFGVTKNNLKKILIPVPSMKEQILIAEHLINMRDEISLLEYKLSKVKSIKQGLMQNLLTGKIRLL